MLLSMVPAVGAVETADVAESETSVEETIDDALNRQLEDELRMKEAETEAALRAKDAKLEAEILANEAKLRAEARAEMARMEDELASAELDEVFSLPEADALNASGSKVTVNVKFPKATPDGGQVRVYLISPAEVDDNGKVVVSPSYWSRSVFMDAGESSTSVTFDSIPTGDYFVSVNSYAPGTGSYMRYEVFFNADGTVADNEYVATSTKISAAKTFNITMPKPERTISGTVEFSEPLKENTWFEVNLQSYDTHNGMYSYYDFELEKGSTSFDFNFGVLPGNYYLRFYGNQSGYADLYGTISNDSTYRMYTNVTVDSITDLVIDGDPLLPKDEEQEEEEGIRVSFSAKLPEKLEDWNEYMLLLYDEDDNLYTTSWLSAEYGDTATNARTFTFQKDFKFKVAYAEAVNADYNWDDDWAAPRFIGEDGITSKIEDAKIFTVGSSDMDVVIDDTKCYVLSGTLNLENPCSVDYQAGYVLATFDNGEVFGSRVNYWQGDESAEYKLYIPKTMSGSFDVTAAYAISNRYMSIDESTLVSGGTAKVSDTTLPTMTLPAPEINVTGTFSLPDGIVAPKSGLAVQLSFNHGLTDYYIIPAGESSFDFAAAVDLPEEDDYLNIWAYPLNAPDYLANEISLSCNADEMTGLEMYLPETVIVSGTLSVPEDCKDLGTTVEVSTSGSLRDEETGDDLCNYNDSVRLSILPGKTSATYALKVLKGGSSNVQLRVRTDTTGKLLTSRLYLQENGTFLTNSRYFEIKEDITANHMYTRGKTFTGKITLANGLSNTYYNGTVYARPTSGGSTYSNSFYFEGSEGTYSVAVPYDSTGDYYIYFNVYTDEANALTEADIYYGPNGAMTFSRDTAQALTPSEEGTKADLVVLKAKTMSGTLSLDSKLPADGYYRGRVYAISVDNGSSYEYYFDSDDGLFYNIKLPTDAEGDFYVAVEMYSGNGTPGNLITNKYLWYTGPDNALSTSSANRVAITVGSGDASLDLVIPSAKMLTGTLTYPADLPTDVEYSGRIFTTSVNSDDELSYYYYDFTGTSMDYALPIPNDATEIKVGFYPYGSEAFEGNIIAGMDYYYIEDGVTTDFNAAKAVQVGADGAQVDLVLPKADERTVNISVPNGFTGTYRGYLYLTGDRDYRANFEFENSGTATFKLPAGLSGNYTLSVYIYEGSGVLTDNTYYYNADGTWNTYSGTASFVDPANLPDITLPAAKTLSGKLVSADGSAIKLDSENSRGYLSLSGASNVSSSIDAEGNFVLSMPENNTGRYRLQYSPSQSSGNNIVTGNTYYYVENATASCHNYSDADTVDMSQGSASGIKLVVDTGYLLSGSFSIADDVTFSTTDDYYEDPERTIGYVNLELTYQVEDEDYTSSYYTNVSLNRSDKTYTYSFVVPKVARTYDAMVENVNVYDAITTNMYLGIVPIGTVSPTSDTTLPAFVLSKAKTAITGTFAFPNYDNSIDTTLYVVAGENVYRADDYIENGESVSVTIPASEQATEYQLYYSLDYVSNNMFLNYTNIYVTADGSLTKDPAKAGSFTWDKTSHSITAMELPPYLTGKIYLPDDLDDTDFSISLRATEWVTIPVNTSTILTDDAGQKYVEYSVRDTDVVPGESSYRMYYSLSSYSGSVLYYSGSYIYLTEDGEPLFSSSDAPYITVPESGEQTIDFALATWESGAEDCIFQSKHGVTSADGTLTYTYTYPDPDGKVTSLSVVYSDRTTSGYYTVNGTEMYLYGGKYDSYSGNTITITFTPSSSYPSYGFGIVSIIPNFSDGSVTEPALTNVYTKDGSSNAQIMSAIADGKPVYTSITAPSGTSGTLIAAVYDDTGRMLDVILEPVSFENTETSYSGLVFGNSTLDFEPLEGAAKLKIMLIDSTSALVPQMAVTTITG